jgi:hypothetical protein
MEAQPGRPAASICGTHVGSSSAKGQAWGLKAIESFHTHGTPPIEPWVRAQCSEPVSGSRAVRQ